MSRFPWFIQTIIQPAWATPEPRAKWDPGPDALNRRATFIREARIRIAAGESTEDRERRRAKAEGLYSPNTYLKDIKIVRRYREAL